MKRQFLCAGLPLLLGSDSDLRLLHRIETMNYIYSWQDSLIPRIREAMAAEGHTHYKICCGADEAMKRCLAAAIDDQLIDSHLESVSFEIGTCRRGCGIEYPEARITAETLPTLIRRLAQPLSRHWEEMIDEDTVLGDEMQFLASSILDTLGIPAEISI